MSVYEVLVFAALAGAAAYAFFLYRSDSRAPKTRETAPADQLMFRRTPQDGAADRKRPGAKS
ncbi:hypothetical protein [Reyranella sp.]|uniref:hypothetical protein n=1 Tax=Reyranella sp. TaxID=1929291 RepID=UPI003D0C0764